MSNVQRFGAVGDGTTDDTEAIRHAVADGDGVLHFPPGSYRISEPIEVRLEESGPLGIDGTSGAARVLMTGPGPAFRLVGTHGGTGDPNSIKRNVYPAQRLPTIRNIEIEGGHPEADGLELLETMQSVFEGVLVRRCRHGIHLTKRNRNVLVNGCHVYHNTGVGVFLDEVNLHQINIAGSHISYNRQGGIRIERSEVRNLQITGNDIEYNNYRSFGTEPEPTAEIYIDTTAEGASVNEVAVASNTIQATPSPGGANLRIIEQPGQNRPPGLWTVTGNIIGNQENNVHLQGCYGIVLSGNCIYTCTNRNLLLEQCQQISVTGNVFRRHTPNAYTGVRLVDSADCPLSGCIIQDEDPEGQKSGASLLELVRCERINVQGCQLLGGAPYGIDAERCSRVNINGCTVFDPHEPPRSRGAIRFRGVGVDNMIAGCMLGAVGKHLQLDEDASVTVYPGLGEED